MEFAKKLMSKYGWNEGEGIGKNKSGIKKPLKAHLKFDTSGFGVDKASDFNNHWWQRVYNEAAKNVEVKENDGQVSVKVDQEDSVEISTKNYSIKKLKKKQGKNGYNHFLKSSTLTNAGNEVENPNRVKVEDFDIPKFTTLTDEELFAACGNRTAHKGARHGLNLTGKLRRLEEQEQKLLNKYVENEDISDKMSPNENEWTIVSKKKKNKKEESDSMKIDENINLDSVDKITYNTEYISKSKKKKKRQKETEQNLSNTLETCAIDKKIRKSTEANDENLKLSVHSKTIKKKSKKKKLKISAVENNMDLDEKLIAIQQDTSEHFNENNINNNFDKSEENSIEFKPKEIKKKDKLKKPKVNKLKCKDKIIAKKIKKTMNVLKNLDSFLSTNQDNKN